MPLRYHRPGPTRYIQTAYKLVRVVDGSLGTTSTKYVRPPFMQITKVYDVFETLADAQKAKDIMCESSTSLAHGCVIIEVKVRGVHTKGIDASSGRPSYIEAGKDVGV